MNTSKADKISLRREVLEQRKKMSLSDVAYKSNVITQKLIESDAYKEANCIYAYISTRNEVDLRRLIENAWTEGKRIAVPRVSGQVMEFYYIKSYNELVKGHFGILEPSENAKIANEKSATIIIPGVAYDKYYNRIGYGGGYYDRYLSTEHKHYIIAPAYDFQVVDSILSEVHDIKVNEIISESENYIRNKNDKNS